MPQHEMGHVFAGPGPEPLVEAREAAGNEPTMRAGLQAATKPPAPPVGWDTKSTGSHPGAQIHHEGQVHNPRATMTIEMPPAGAVPKGETGPPRAPGAEIRKDTLERT